jgi:tripartite-type tricarboxylate transporter receptor subunit TctC
MDRVLKTIAGLLMGLITAAAAAQSNYPERPVRFIIGFPPGGAPDLTARVLGLALGEAWAKPVIVESRVGAAGNVAASHAAKSTPDGYTLLLSGDAAMTTNVSLYDKLPYEPLRHFIPITLATTVTNVLVVHPSVQARSLQELIALAKSQPGKLNYASAGSGTSQHLAGELLKSMASIDIVHVPYKGAAFIPDVLAGRVTMAFPNTVFSLSHLKDGKLRGLAVTSLKRASVLPDLPTLAESGLSGFEAIAWFGLLAPAGTPDVIIRKVHRDTVKILASTDVHSKLASVGLEIVGSSPEEFAARIKEEIVRKGRLIKASGAKPD